VRNDEPGPQPRLVRWIGSGDEAGFPAPGSVFGVPAHLGEQDVEVDVAVVVDVLGGEGVLIPPATQHTAGVGQRGAKPAVEPPVSVIVHHGEHQVVDAGAAVQISQGVPSDLLDFPGRNGMWRWGTYNLEGHTPDFSKGGGQIALRAPVLSM
jgi:hypothetical protein